MMTATLQTMATLRPRVKVKGSLIKIDMGALVVEFDLDGFNQFLFEILSQARDQGIELQYPE